MKTVAVAGQKGGIGKTSTALAVWDWYTRQGKKALALDFDAQGNCSFAAGFDQDGGPSSMDVIMRQATAPEAVRHMPSGDLIPAAPALATADVTLSQTGKEFRAKEALETVAASYDVAIVDCPPSLGVVTINALTAADFVLVPSTPDIFSLQGIGQLAQTLDVVRKYCNQSLRVAGILLTQFPARSILARDIADTAGQMAAQLGTKVFTARIRSSVAIREAQMRRTSLFAYAPRAAVAADYEACMRELQSVVGA